MKAMLTLLICAMVAEGADPSDVLAQKGCPPEVAQAEAALKSVQTTVKGKPVAKGQAPQAPRVQAGARTQEVNAPRTQEVNAPRTQEVNAPRTQEVNAPRTQEVNAPRTQDVNAPRSQGVSAPRTQEVNAPRTQDVNAPRVQDKQAPSGGTVREQDIDAPRVKQAEALVSQAQAACKKGDMAAASAKAKQALAVLK
jgi:hypothetical protein